MSFKVMTFNIRGAFPGDGVNVWPNRAALNVATIKRHAPDLIGCQEMQTANLDTYRARLEGYDHVLGPPTTRLSNMPIMVFSGGRNVLPWLIPAGFTSAKRPTNGLLIGHQPLCGR
jgi:hypothetical protein